MRDEYDFSDGVRGKYEQAEPEQRTHNCWWVDEVERLREALEKIVGSGTLVNISGAAKMKRIARDALGTQE